MADTVTDAIIDRDLIANPPVAITSDHYSGLFRAHIVQATQHFDRSLPRQGLLSLFRRGIASNAREALCATFAAAYERFLTETVIPLMPNNKLDGVMGTGAERFRVAIAFVTRDRSLIVADRFSISQREIRSNTSEDDEDSVVYSFMDELVATVGRIVSSLDLTKSQKFDACYRAASRITLDLDYRPLDQAVDGRAVAPVLCYVDTSERLVLLPNALKLHEGIDSVVGAYLNPGP